MKKFIALILAAAMSVAQLTAFAANETIDVQVNEISVYADDKYIDSDNFLYRDRTFIPLRGVLEALKCEVFYDEQTNSANAYNVVEMVLDMYRVATDAYQSIVESDYQMTIAFLLYNLDERASFERSCNMFMNNKKAFDAKYEAGKGIAEIGKYAQSMKANYIAEKTQELFDMVNKAYEAGEIVLDTPSDKNLDKYSDYVDAAIDLYNDIDNTVSDFGYDPD